MLLSLIQNDPPEFDRELESVIAQRNLLTCRTRRKVLDDLAEAAADTEDTHVRILVVLFHEQLA